jgi:hypothetical protein
MIAAGFDTMWLPTVPSSRMVGVGARILMDVADAQMAHTLLLIYQDQDGRRLSEIRARFGPLAADQQLPPAGRPVSIPVAFNLPLPVPAYGDYSLELFFDDQTEAAKSITLTVTAQPLNAALLPPRQPGPAGDA